MKSSNAMLEADVFGWIPLHYAAHFGHVEVVKLILKENISLAYIGDRERMSTLHISAKEGHVVVIKHSLQNVQILVNCWPIRIVQQSM